MEKASRLDKQCNNFHVRCTQEGTAQEQENHEFDSRTHQFGTAQCPCRCRFQRQSWRYDRRRGGGTRRNMSRTQHGRTHGSGASAVHRPYSLTIGARHHQPAQTQCRTVDTRSPAQRKRSCLQQNAIGSFPQNRRYKVGTTGTPTDTVVSCNIAGDSATHLTPRSIQAECMKQRSVYGDTPLNPPAKRRLGACPCPPETNSLAYSQVVT